MVQFHGEGEEGGRICIASHKLHRALADIEPIQISKRLDKEALIILHVYIEEVWPYVQIFTRRAGQGSAKGTFLIP